MCMDYIVKIKMRFWFFCMMVAASAGGLDNLGLLNVLKFGGGK